MATKEEMFLLAKQLSMDIPEEEAADYTTFLARTEKTLELIAAMDGKTGCILDLHQGFRLF